MQSLVQLWRTGDGQRRGKGADDSDADKGARLHASRRFSRSRKILQLKSAESRGALQPGQFLHLRPLSVKIDELLKRLVRVHRQAVVGVHVNAMKFFAGLRHRIDVDNNIGEVADGMHRFMPHFLGKGVPFLKARSINGIWFCGLKWVLERRRDSFSGVFYPCVMAQDFLRIFH
jgi:hypothetical protein